MTVPTPVLSPAVSAPTVAPGASGHHGLLHDPALFDKAYAKVRAMDHIQYEFPVQKFVPSKPPPKWQSESVDFFGRNNDGMLIFLYILLGLALLYILYRLFPSFRDRVDSLLGRVKTARTDEEEEWHPEIERAKELLAEADELAAGGHYAEAVHYLLRRSIQDIGRRRPQLLRPSLTARDIARSPELPDVARDAFVTIADVVELSHFGRRPVDKAGWDRCREAYSRFALRENWSAPTPSTAPSADLAGALA